jgi:hypothetical protein
MPEKFLNRANVIPGLEQVCRETVAKRVRTDGFDHIHGPGSLLHRPLQAVFTGMVSSPFPGPGINRDLGGREHLLPAPFPGRVRILSLQRVGEINLSETAQ